MTFLLNFSTDRKVNPLFNHQSLIFQTKILNPSIFSSAFSLTHILLSTLSFLPSTPSLMMKDRFKYSSFTIFLIFILAERKLSLAVTPSFDACEPKTCGNFSITYPFWLNLVQQSYCGYPGFNLSCRENRSNPLTATILGVDYYIKNIFYNNNSFQLTVASFVDQKCPYPHYNFTYALYPLRLGNNKEIYFLFNCSNSLYAYTQIKCNPYGNQSSYFAGEYNAPPTGNDTCVSVQVPVVKYSAAKSVDYIDLLREGWLLDWSMPDCTRCSASGGRCGYDDSNGSFMCICHDGVHKTSCSEYELIYLVAPGDK